MIKQPSKKRKIPGAVVLLCGALVVVAGYGFNGITKVSAQQLTVVVRFGKAVRTLQPGINWVPPYIAKTQSINKNNINNENFTATSIMQNHLIFDTLVKYGYTITDLKTYLNVSNQTGSLIQATVMNYTMQYLMQKNLTKVTAEDTAALSKILNTHLRAFGVKLDTIKFSKFTILNQLQQNTDLIKTYGKKMLTNAHDVGKKVIAAANLTAQQVITEAKTQSAQIINYSYLLINETKALSNSYAKHATLTPIVLHNINVSINAQPKYKISILPVEVTNNAPKKDPSTTKQTKSSANAELNSQNNSNSYVAAQLNASGDY